MVKLTQLAAEHILKKLQERGKGLGIRVGVKSSGCSGFAYVLEYVDTIVDWNPLVYHCNGVSIYVDPKDTIYFDGLCIDWKKVGLNEGFDFINPKEVNRCGCGESFQI